MQQQEKLKGEKALEREHNSTLRWLAGGEN